MLQSLANMFYRLPRKLQQPLERTWYECISYLDRDADMIFMNYGWASLDREVQSLALRPEDEPNRYCIQLYHRVASAVHLADRDVLEVGCGRGGGASYVKRYLQPTSLTGLDLTSESIKFCRRQHTMPGLTFVRGKAEALEFDAQTFDAVINVESSHCYMSMEHFMRGVHRVLKPGGYFLYADHRDKEDVDAWRRQLEDAGLTIVEEEVINPNVTRALELDNARKQALIAKKVPRLVQPFFDEFAAMEGTHSLYATLCSGDKIYMRFVLQKQ